MNQQRPPHRPTLHLAAVAMAALALTACGGGGDSGEPSSTAQHAVLAWATPLSVGTTCATGGAQIDAGMDTNGNGVLDPAEITSTQQVCNGVTGTTGATGATGAAGQNGSSTLVSLAAEPSGSNCSAGGTKISVGLDTNGNGVLDNAEISGSPSYVCGGVPGAAGAAGTNGASGTNGTNGTNGRSSLIAMTPETAGSNCTHGGTKVSSGLDANNNGQLNTLEVTATSYNCNGAPGAGISWVDVTGTSVQAVSGIGYVADNAAPVTITLPTAPAIGDLIEVSGSGLGGWQIAQNAAQSIVTKALPTWTALSAAGTRAWQSIASSADGSKLVAVALEDQIYTSTDFGVSWTARESARHWNAVASSSDGSRLVAVVFGDQIYTSSNSGVSWAAQDEVRNWVSVASSSDGSKLVAAEYGGQIYTSTDYGVNWTARDSVRVWYAVASSADGSKLVAVEKYGQVYTSNDAGLNWTARDSVRNWVSVASSADGSALVAVEQYGQIYTSSDFGVNWTARDSAHNWYSVASSSSGSKLAAADQSGQIHISTDFGVSWASAGSGGSWAPVALSGDGSMVVSGVMGGEIYTDRKATRTTVGTGGSLSGSQYDAIRLQYIGNGLFMPLSATSYSGSFTVH